MGTCSYDVYSNSDLTQRPRRWKSMAPGSLQGYIAYLEPERSRPGRAQPQELP